MSSPKRPIDADPFGELEQPEWNKKHKSVSTDSDLNHVFADPVPNFSATTPTLTPTINPAPAPAINPTPAMAAPPVMGVEKGPEVPRPHDSKQDDPSKLNDAIAAAGVNIQHEEEILLLQQQHRRTDVSRDLKQFIKSSKPPSYLNPYHVATFMSKIARENGIHQRFLHDQDMLELISAACEYWLANIITKTVLLSRHRRRGIPSLPLHSLARSKKQPSNPHRSELQRELRNMATRQKELEEKRVAKRILLGLEKSGAQAAAEQAAEGKAGAEETLHRAANATAAMMAQAPGRKKYSWMAAGQGESPLATGGEKDKSRESPLILMRGDNGLRYREIRTGNQISVKDLLGVLEDERMGTEKAVVKGYARLKE